MCAPTRNAETAAITRPRQVGGPAGDEHQRRDEPGRSPTTVESTAESWTSAGSAPLMTVEKSTTVNGLHESPTSAAGYGSLVCSRSQPRRSARAPGKAASTSRPDPAGCAPPARGCRARPQGRPRSTPARPRRTSRRGRRSRTPVGCRDRRVDRAFATSRRLTSSTLRRSKHPCQEVSYERTVPSAGTAARLRVLPTDVGLLPWGCHD